MKLRLDKLLHDRGLAPSRERAQALIIAGKVLVNGQKAEKPGAQVAEDAELRMLGDDNPYVSRGGIKLAHALKQWKMDLTGLRCADIGASTGGFTDCMLQHGAAHVTAVDTGYGQIAEQLRRDPRVTLLERTNARNLEPNAFGGRLDFVAMDVSFISATLVLPAVVEAAFGPAGKRGGRLVVLVKPQFEVGRELVGKGGIVKDAGARQGAVEKVTAKVSELGAKTVQTVESPITGAEGNVEYLLYAVFEP